MVLSNRLGWIGVDIGTHTVKLAQAMRTPAGISLRHAAVIQRPSPWSEDDTLGAGEPNPSHAEIAAALECGGFKGRNAACLLPMNICELRGLNVPKGLDLERRAMISNELADDWENRPAPMEFDFWELGGDGAPETVDGFNVNVMAIARPWISQLHDDCRHAHLDCWAVDGAPLSIARAVGAVAKLRSDQRVLAIDWGFSNTTLCVVGGQRPMYARRINQCSFRKCLETIQSTLGISLDHAQHLVDVQGVVPPEGDQKARGDRDIQVALTDALSETIEHLVEQIQRTLRFVELQRRHLKPTALWLVGGGASVRNIDAHLSAKLALPVHSWNVPCEPGLEDMTQGGRTALFGEAFALSTLAWRAA